MIQIPFYEANRNGNPIPRLKGTIDLIFAREPVAANRNAKPYEIFDGQKLVPIRDYLKAHPRPDLIRLEERVNGLSEVHMAIALVMFSCSPALARICRSRNDTFFLQ